MECVALFSFILPRRTLLCFNHSPATFFHRNHSLGPNKWLILNSIPASAELIIMIKFSALFEIKSQQYWTGAGS